MASTILSDNGVTSGSAGLKTTAASDGALALQTTTAGGAATTALTIDTSQNVGIGTASPTAKLTVNNATATDYLSLTTAGSTKGVLADEAGDLIIKSAASLLFQTNGSIRARLNTTGAFVLAGGTTTANGIGIAFPATQSASSNANTLDDYEEGTWTPTITRNTTNPTITYTNQFGSYVKIGRLVYVSCQVSWSANTGGSGIVYYISGLPFTNTNSGADYSQTVIADFGGITFGAGATQFGGYVGINETRVVLTSGGSTISSNLVTVGSSGYIYMTGVYVASN